MTPTREQVIEPFGYVSDGFHDGLRFQHKPWPEMHMLVRSVSAVYSAAQLNAEIERAYSAGRLKGLDEAKEVCYGERVADTGEESDAAYNAAIEHCAAAIDQLKEQK